MSAWIAPSGTYQQADPSTIIGLVVIFLVYALGGFLLARLRRFMKARHSPEYQPRTPLAKWFSGLIFSSSELLRLAMQALWLPPFLFGAGLIFGGEYFYLRNPSVSLLDSPGLVIAGSGILLLLLALQHWKEKFDFIRQSTGIFHFFNRLDAYILIAFSGTSAVMLVSALWRTPIAWNCLWLSAAALLASAGSAFWMLKNTKPLEQNYTEFSKYGFDPSFRLSKIAEPPVESNRDPEIRIN